MMRVITIILGVLLLLGGFYCMFAPVATYAAIGWLIGASMVVEGIASIVIWNTLRKEGLANGWMLAGAIISLVLGVFLLGSYAMQFAVDMFIAYMIAIWLVFAGISHIAFAINIRSQAKTGAAASGWILQLVLGVLTAIFGVLCIFNPLAVVAGVGLMLGVSIVFVGAGLITSGFSMESR